MGGDSWVSRLMSFSCSVLFVTQALLVTGCGRANPPNVPEFSDVASIALDLDPNGCCGERFLVTDGPSIQSILDEYRRLDDGWSANDGTWLTPKSSGGPYRARFRNAEGQTIHLFWFGDDETITSRTFVRLSPGVYDSLGPDVYRGSSKQLILAVWSAKRFPSDEPAY